MLEISKRTAHLKQSGIRRASTECARIGGINLGQGVCDLPTPNIIKQNANKIINEDKNTYSACEGVLDLRKAIAKKVTNFNRIPIDPHSEVVVTHGSTGAFICAVMTLFNPGEEAIVFEPFYGYHKNILELYGVSVKSVPISMRDFSIDMEQLKNTISTNTRAIIICTPCNPCGKVFSREELLAIGEIATIHNLAVITDEIYEYITYPGFEHVSFASLRDHKARTITISGFSKTYNMTGWRLGYATGPEHIIAKMALVQDLIYVCPATPLQHAVIAAFSLGDDYYQNMRELYLQKRDAVVSSLRNMGFKLTVPQGAYYIMIDFSDLDFTDDQSAADEILKQAKVATVPGHSFYIDPKQGIKQLRICYALAQDRVMQALDQMQNMLASAASILG